MSKVEIITLGTVRTMEIAAQASMLTLPRVVGKSYKAILALLSQNNQKPASAPYIRYLDLDWDAVGKGGFFARIGMLFHKWNMLIGFPVEPPLPGEGAIRPGTLPSGMFVQMLHKGSYYKVGNAYKTMLAEIRENGLHPKNESIELYLNDPACTKTEDLETLVLIPLKQAP
jgi:effector-binding domain-containing protein